MSLIGSFPLFGDDPPRPPSIEELFVILLVAARRAPSLEEHHRLFDVAVWVRDVLGEEVDWKACEFAAEWQILASST